MMLSSPSHAESDPDVTDGSSPNPSSGDAVDAAEGSASDACVASEPTSIQNADIASVTSCASEDSNCTDSSSFSGTADCFPWRLEAALAAIDYAGVPYRAKEYQLPAPGLIVNGLSEPLALPLVPLQAEEIIALASGCDDGASADRSGGNCFQIGSDQLTFENPDWDGAVDEVMQDFCFHFGWMQGSFKSQMRGLVLCAASGRLSSHAHTEKGDGMFATLTIQLPSHFKGGEVRIRYNGQEKILGNGADDGTTCFKSFCTVCFTDVEQEMRPVAEGYRLTLVYHLFWIGKDGAPTANAGHIGEVEAALQEHAERSPAGDWFLAFMLEHEYTSAALSTHGIEALREADRRNIEALKSAAEVLGIGELDFVLIRLLKGVHMYRVEGVGQFEVSFFSSTRVVAAESYWDTGELFGGELDWIDWNFVSFTLGKHKRRVDEDGPMIANVCNAMAVIVWAKEMKVEALFRAWRYDVGHFLNDEDLSQPSDARADRILGCIERRGPGHEVAWKQTNDVLEFCLERGLHEQASRGIRMASTFSRTRHIDIALFQYVSRYGWEVVGNALEHYLCSRSIPKRCSVVFRLCTLFQLMPCIPQRITLDALAIVVKFVERHERSRLRERHVCRYRTCDSKRYHRELWVTLMSIVVELELSCTESEISSTIDDFAVRLGTVMEGFDESRSKAVSRALSQGVMKKTSKHLEQLHAVCRRRFLYFRRERFEKMATFVTTHKTTPERAASGKPYDYEGYDKDSDPRVNWERVRDWLKFISLSSGVVSGEDVSATTSVLVEKVSNTIGLLPRVDIDALAQAVTVVSGGDRGFEEDAFCMLFEDKIREALPDIG